MSTKLYHSVIRVAYTHPELRRDLLPLLVEAAWKAETPLGAKKLYQRYKREHPETKKGPKDFYDPSTKGKAKPEPGRPRTKSKGPALKERSYEETVRRSSKNKHLHELGIIKARNKIRETPEKVGKLAEKALRRHHGAAATVLKKDPKDVTMHDVKKYLEGHINQRKNDPIFRRDQNRYLGVGKVPSRADEREEHQREAWKGHDLAILTEHLKDKKK